VSTHVGLLAKSVRRQLTCRVQRAEERVSMYGRSRSLRLRRLGMSMLMAVSNSRTT
jgi:hypothetical protein